MAHEKPPDERIGRWADDEIHRVRVSERMLEELLVYGITTTSGSSLVGPELLVLETVHDAEDVYGAPPVRLTINHVMDADLDAQRERIEQELEEMVDDA
jgi:hypothetical protein